MTTDLKDQQHPQYRSDRLLVSQLMVSEPTDRSLVELARLLIRYRDFPGARDIQEDLTKTLSQWNLTEASLFEQTRSIHQKGEVYRDIGRNREDWS